MMLNTTQVTINGITLHGIALIEKARPKIWVNGVRLEGVKFAYFTGPDGERWL
jgi:hypothetical protein